MQIGDYHFSYDDNGNLIRESDVPAAETGGGEDESPRRIGDVRVIDRAWGWVISSTHRMRSLATRGSLAGTRTTVLGRLVPIARW